MNQHKVLIVEDERELNEAYQIILKQHDFEVRAAYDGNEALNILETFEPDVILLDLRMPVMGGIEFLTVYASHQQGARAKIIVFSNLDTQSEIDEAFALGADKYMLKAWASPNELVQLVKDTLGHPDKK